MGCGVRVRLFQPPLLGEPAPLRRGAGGGLRVKRLLLPLFIEKAGEAMTDEMI